MQRAQNALDGGGLMLCACGRVLECESRFPVAGPGLLGRVFVRAGCVGVVCGIYVIYARCLRVSVQSAHFSTEVAYRIRSLALPLCITAFTSLASKGGDFNLCCYSTFW